MRFRGHETFHIRKGWLNKGIRNVIAVPDVFISKDENPMDVLGIGSNMVKSLRYWLQATELTQEPKSGRRCQKLTELGKVIYENDPYFEEIGTLWLVHCALAENEAEATAWYVFFNEFDLNEFSDEDFEKRIKKYISMNYSDEEMPKSRTINEDFKCIISTYYSKSRTSSNDVKENPEDNMECPLTELGLVSLVSSQRGIRIYRKDSPKSENIPELVVLAMILRRYKNQKEIRISALQNDINSIGKVFCLNTLALHNVLYKLDTLGYLSVVRTAGLDVIRLETNMTYIECIQQYYQGLNER